MKTSRIAALNAAGTTKFRNSEEWAYLIVAYAAYIGEMGEGMVIDSDHWRHFFLLVGLIWGLSVANINWRRRQILERQTFAIDTRAAMLPAAT